MSKTFIFSTIITGRMSQQSLNGITHEEFKRIMKGVADSWNAGDARSAVDYFHQEAVYEEPPRQQFYQGKESIYEFFMAVSTGDTPMSMTWHNLAFNEEYQTGFGEYTFARLKKFNGIVAIKIQDGKILKWREYQYESELERSVFAGASMFETTE